LDPWIKGNVDNKVEDYINNCVVLPEEMGHLAEIVPISRLPIEFVLGYHIGRIVELVYKNLQSMDYKYGAEVKQHLIQQILEAKVPLLYKRIQTELNR
jgi:hypothetical protein